MATGSHALDQHASVPDMAAAAELQVHAVACLVNKSFACCSARSRWPHLNILSCVVTSTKKLLTSSSLPA